MAVLLAFLRAAWILRAGVMWWRQIGANAQQQVVLCSVNGTGTGSQKNCGPGFVCAPLSRADLDAEASFNANSVTPQPSLAGALPPYPLTSPKHAFQSPQVELLRLALAMCRRPAIALVTLWGHARNH